MAFSYTEQTGDGVTTVFPFSFSGAGIGYIRESDIVVLVNGVETEDFTFSGTNQIQFNVAPPAPVAPWVGPNIMIRRVVPKDRPYADFSRGNNFGQEQMNYTVLQQLYALHEFLDGFLPEGYFVKGDMDFKGNKLVNLGSPTLPQDAVTFAMLQAETAARQAGNSTALALIESLRHDSGSLDRPYVDIRALWMEADGDDYAPALARAIAAHPTGANITFPSGTFDFSPNNTFTGLHRFRISGQGPSTVIRPKWDGTLPYVSAHLFQFIDSSDIVVEDIYFDGRISEGMLDYHPQPLWFINCDTLSIKGCKFFNMKIQDRSAIGLYGCSNYKVYYNSFIDTDVGVMMYNAPSGQNIVCGNTFMGGYSEAICVYTDSWLPQSTCPRTTLITGNYICDKDSTGVNIFKSSNAGVVVSNNIIQARSRTDFSAVVVSESSDVEVSGNFVIGLIHGVRLYGQSDRVRVKGNRFLYTLSIAANLGTEPNVLSGVEITDNMYTGPVAMDAYSGTKVYYKGDFAQYGGVFYQSITHDNVGNPTSDNSKWVAASSSWTAQGVISGNFRDSRIERNTVSDAVWIALGLGTSDSNVRVVDNVVKNCLRAVYYPVGSATVNGIVFRGNYFEGTSAVDSAVVLSGYKMVGCSFVGNTVTTTSTPEPFSSSIKVVERSYLHSNTFQGGGTYSFAEFGGAWIKFNNSFEKVPNSSRYKSAPINGYVVKGQKIEDCSPSVGGYLWRTCTTAGYAHSGSWSSGTSYSKGTCQLGSDGKVYESLVDSNLGNDPISSPSQWQLSGLVGTPVAVMTGAGYVEPSTSGLLKSTAGVGVATATPDVDYVPATAATTPTSGASGTPGAIRWDSSYIYICVANNTWKRAALSSF